MDQNSMMGGVPPMQQDPNTQIQTSPSMVQPAMSAPYGPQGQFGAPMNPAQNIAMNTQAAGAPAKKNSALMETIVLVFVCIIAAVAIVFAVTFFIRWRKLQDNFEAQVATKVADAERVQKEKDEANFAEREKEPFAPFAGPEDYGGLSFSYPKTWSVYEENGTAKNGSYAAYFAPSYVSSLSDNTSRYALRFQIISKSFSDVSKEYESKVSSGKLRSSPYNNESNTLSGTRYDGELGTDMYGTVIIVKVNDKTALFQSDATDFAVDFEKVMQSLERAAY